MLFSFLNAKMLIKWIESKVHSLVSSFLINSNNIFAFFRACRHLLSQDIVALLLGSSSHEQIIKRSPGILKFLAASNALTVRHIDLLWGAGVGKHEDLVRVVYATLADLTQVQCELALN